MGGTSLPFFIDGAEFLGVVLGRVVAIFGLFAFELNLWPSDEENLHDRSQFR